MRKMLLGAAFGALLPMTAAACGQVSITDMNWASSAIVTQVAKFLMEQGYGCEVTLVPSDTVPAVTSLSENNEPDIVTEMYTSGGGDAYLKLREQGRIKEQGEVITPGSLEGWWIPTYLAEKHPELATIEGVKANPALVGGVFNNAPDGWGSRIVNDNLIRALGLEAVGIEVFNHGSGETLATSMAAAYEDGKPWFGYYWGPTKLLGKYDMIRVDLGVTDPAAHARNQNADRAEPEISNYPPAPVQTVVTTDFAAREPEIAALMTKMSFTVDKMSSLLAWQDANNASAEETAVRYLSENKDIWSAWLNDAARENLAGLLK